MTPATVSGSGRSEPPRLRTALGGGGEFDLVRRFLEGWEAGERGGVRLGPGDDAAVLEVAGEEGDLVLTCDLTVEDVHFRRAWIEPREIGYRAVAVALSDLAAMAAVPTGVLVAAAMRPSEAEGLVEPLRDGIRAACETVGATLLGGDLSRSPGPLVLDVTAVGRAPRPLLRSDARPGDELWVTGHLGATGAAVEAWLRGEEPEPACRRAFARPVPRIAEARWLSEREGVRALLDLSDGLAGDAGHLAAASGVGVVLVADDVPVHPAVESGSGGREEGLRLALRAGEDYELLVAIARGTGRQWAEAFRERFGLALTRVGRVQEGAGVFLESAGSEEPRPLEGGGHSHFDAEGGSGESAEVQAREPGGAEGP